MPKTPEGPAPPTELSLAQIVLDPALYPRHAMSYPNRLRIRAAIEAGIALPPLLVDAQSHRLVDGWHRYHEWRTAKGMEAPVPVRLQAFESEAALLEAAITANVGRGEDLSPWDLVRCTELGAVAGLPPDRIAALVHWMPETLAAYLASRTAATATGGVLHLKRSLRHKAGETLTPAQEAANVHADGMSPLYHVNQLRLHLAASTLDPSNMALREGLAALSEEAAAWVGSLEASA